MKALYTLAALQGKGVISPTAFLLRRRRKNTIAFLGEYAILLTCKIVREGERREHEKMANRITVTISGMDYTLMSEESPSYMQKVAALVDEKMTDITASGRVSRMDAAVLAAANLADELLKQQSAAENLRRQLKGYLDEAGKAKAELGECKRELLKLQQQKR